MANNNDMKVVDMFFKSETKPRIRKELISREQYLAFLDKRFEEHKVLCVDGEEGVGVTTKDPKDQGTGTFIHTFGTIYSLKNRYPCVA